MLYLEIKALPFVFKTTGSMKLPVFGGAGVGGSTRKWKWIRLDFILSEMLAVILFTVVHLCGFAWRFRLLTWSAFFSSWRWLPVRHWSSRLGFEWHFCCPTIKFLHWSYHPNSGSSYEETKGLLNSEISISARVQVWPLTGLVYATEPWRARS